MDEKRVEQVVEKQVDDLEAWRQSGNHRWITWIVLAFLCGMAFHACIS